jgi:starvation-inducible DNA-binding protein
MNNSATGKAAGRSGSLSNEAVSEISEGLRRLLADAFCLYPKTKNFHWHMTGSHFSDYHLLLDEQADQVFAMTDVIAERGWRIGANTLRSIGDVSRWLRSRDNAADDLYARNS